MTAAIGHERAVIQAARGFLQAYRSASVADEEGLASYADFRAAWDECATAADEFEQALHAWEDSRPGIASGPGLTLGLLRGDESRRIEP